MYNDYMKYTQNMWLPWKLRSKVNQESKVKFLAKETFCYTQGEKRWIDLQSSILSEYGGTMEAGRW